MTYQYSSFGVPGLDCDADSARMSSSRPMRRAWRRLTTDRGDSELRRLAAPGPRRLRLLRGARLHRGPLPEVAQVAVIRAYMAHHQGMVVVAIANVVHDGAMRARFHAEPIVQATRLLLQERTPRDVARSPGHVRTRCRPSYVREFVRRCEALHLAATARYHAHSCSRTDDMQ